MHAVKAFVQAGLITYSGSIALNPNPGKADLAATPVLKTLKGRIQSEH